MTELTLITVLGGVIAVIVLYCLTVLLAGSMAGVMAKPDDESCAICRYYQPDEKLAGVYGERTGWCLRNPPHFSYIDQETSRTLARFGTTTDSWWCGEFSKTKTPPPAVPSQNGVNTMTQYIGVYQGQTVTVVGVPKPTGAEVPSHPIVLPGDPGWPKPPPGPVDPGYSPPWAIVGEPKPPVDPGYSPPWATLPIEPPTEPPPVDPPPPQQPGHWVWAYSPQLGRWVWVKVPGEGEAGPKKK